ncbi:MAG: chorismate synthase [Cardiobacteriaceae bacterium]|nr:chorismate synthase [Cardiobacteriaceae bacterium]
MSGNTFGTLFSLTTFGESHGIAIGGILDGCPAGLPFDIDFIQRELDRRKPGTSKFVTPRQESDQVQILSGIFEGKTTGTPIGFVIYNQDQRSQDYSNIKALFRPGHADYTYQAKYGIRDYRGGGRSSARETASRVVGGAIAKIFLASLGIEVRAFLSQLGEHRIDFIDLKHCADNPFNCPNEHQIPLLERYLGDIRREGDSIGAELTVIATGVPAGLGEPVFDRLDADLAKALMSVNAVKAVSIGDGFEAVKQRGSEHRDERTAEIGFLSNHAGGILGGISSGQTIIAKAAFKPTSSILVEGKTTNLSGENATVSTHGRHDPCVALRACPIVEAMVALTLADHVLRQRGQNAEQWAEQSAIHRHKP